MGSQRGQKMEENQKTCSSSFTAQTFLLRWMKPFLHKFPLLGLNKHNAQQMPLEAK
jgi:hypothetical protein